MKILKINPKLALKIKSKNKKVIRLNKKTFDQKQLQKLKYFCLS